MQVTSYKLYSVITKSTTFLFIHAHSLFSVFPARADDSGGRHSGIQAGFQLALLASSLGISIFGGLLTGECTQY
jgi:hypothetical protein